MENKRKERMFQTVVKSGVLKKFPLLGSTISSLEIVPDNNIETAATDGNKIYYNPKFIETLSAEDKNFVFSHEIMHVAFNHVERGKDKNSQQWNIAADAVINQILKNEGLTIPENAINDESAINKSTEEVYEELMKSSIENKFDENSRKNTQQQHKKWDDKSKNNQGENKEQSKSSAEDKNQGQNNNGNEQGESQQKQDQNQGNKCGESGQKLDQNGLEDGEKPKQNQGNGEEDAGEFEKQFIEQNKKLKDKLGEHIRNRLDQQRINAEASKERGGYSDFLGNVGYEPAKLSWKSILKKEFEKEEDSYTYRRADEENDFMARIQSREVDESPAIEVLLDTSGSVSEGLLISFLRQLKQVLKEVRKERKPRLKVGCFDTDFYGFVEIKSEADIDNFRLRGFGGTSFDTALASFSEEKPGEKNKINKIIFTDGYDTVSNTAFNRKKKVFWIVYKNMDFNPCCGKVINVSLEEIYNNEKTR